jgi:hypothetical protein
MKIYIVDILPATIKSKIQSFDTSFIRNEKYKYEYISNDCGFYIESYTNSSEQIVRLEPSFNNNYELITNYNGHNLLVDKTEYTYIPVVSQLPVDYICSKMLKLEYKIDKKSKLTFVVECIEETKSFERELIPIDFYFEYDESILDLTNSFFLEDFNVFLLKLN